MTETVLETTEDAEASSTEDDALLDTINVRLVDRSEVTTASTQDGNANSD